MKSGSRRPLPPHVHLGITRNGPDVGATAGASADEWIGNTGCVCNTCVQQETDGKCPFVTTRMDLGGVLLSDISQTQRQILCDLAYAWDRLVGVFPLDVMESPDPQMQAPGPGRLLFQRLSLGVVFR